MKYLIAIVTTLIATQSFSAFAADTRENGGRRAPLAVKIEFTSLGNGINHELRVKIDAIVQDYRDARKVTKISESGWGLEGEVTLCVQLVDFNSAYVLNNAVAELIGDNNRNTSTKRVLSCDGNDKIHPNE